MSLIRNLTTRFGVNKSTSKNVADPSKQDARVYQQQTYRAGLFVTQELDKAIARCKAKVEDIAQECRSRNRRFRDIEFDFDNDTDRCLHGLATADADKFTPADVLRVSEIFDDPHFFVNGTAYNDIVQGSLGDCWFLSAVATLSTMPGLIDKICVARDEKVGIYGFIFCRDGEWADIIIDDQLFTTVPKYETLSGEKQNLYHNDKDLYDKIARKGSKTLYFARSSQENETWVPLLEKAFAKFHGDYASLNGGYAFQALEDLTGGVSQVVYTNDIFDKDRFWREDLTRATKDRLFGCYLDSIAGKGVATDTTTTNGLVSSHAYSILGTVEYKGKRFLKIRNPWGMSEWTGRWSDGSKEWTREWFDALEMLDHNFGNDGAFIMEYEDFLQTWYAVERTQLFDSSWVHSSHWLNASSRAFPCAWQYGDVSFTFSLPQPSPATVVLAQSDTRFYSDISGYSAWSFDFLLYQKGSDRVLGRSEFSVQAPRSVTLNTHLEAGEYVLHVRLDRHYIRPKDYLQQGSWDARKLSKVSSEGAKSMSIASNFDPRRWALHLVVPPETFAGKDLTELEMERFEATHREQETLKDKFFPHPAQVAAAAVEGQPTIENEADPEKGLNDAMTADGTSNDLAKVGEEITNAGSNVSNLENDAVPEASEVVTGGVTSEFQTTDNTVGSVTLGGAMVKIAPEMTEAKNGTLPVLPVHPNIQCDGCSKRIAGVRWKCLMCDDYDLCDDCHASGVQSLEHSVKHRMLRIEDPRAPSAVHEGIRCNGCDIVPIRGTRWKCLVCYDYDLCDACRVSGAHPAEHKMLKIIAPAESEALEEVISSEDDNEVVLGLRVYTKSDAPVNISGQLRHGKLVSWKK